MTNPNNPPIAADCGTIPRPNDSDLLSLLYRGAAKRRVRAGVGVRGGAVIVKYNMSYFGVT